jgi:hypothetical protein
MDRVGCVKIRRGAVGPCCFATKAHKPARLWVSANFVYRVVGMKTRKGRSVGKLERGPQVLRQANPAGGYRRHLQDRHQGESLRFDQACGRIRHAGPAGRFGRRDFARRDHPVRRRALSENQNFTGPAHDGLSKRDSTIGRPAPAVSRRQHHPRFDLWNVRLRHPVLS